MAEWYGEAARDTLLDLVEFGEAAARLVQRGKPAYDGDEALRFASEAIIHRIGEAVARLSRQSPGLIADHPDIEWRQIKGTRNIVAHSYDRIDHEVIWRALTTRMPSVTTYLRTMLGD